MSVTAAAGFRASGAVAGLKPSGKPDVALVVNDGPQRTAAAVFTTNRCKANPVLWTERAITDGKLDAVVLNSGGANCYNGPEGFQTAHASAELVAELLGGGAFDVGVCSTGMIGPLLDRPKLEAGIRAAYTALPSDSKGDGGLAAATAIMTTDTRPKQAVSTGDGWTVGGMAKGAGMLAPGLATMLVLITTDAAADPGVLDGALRRATRSTFEQLDTDGCMSTNDTVILMASGASGVTADGDKLTAAVTTVCADLSRQLWTDAEGAHHDIEIAVNRAASEDDAISVGRAVARSNLFKAAVFGNDPNWGRVLAAIGTTDAVFEPHRIGVAINGVQVCRAGGTETGEPAENVDMSARHVAVDIDLGAGDASATVFTSDLTHDYVHENSAYST